LGISSKAEQHVQTQSQTIRNDDESIAENESVQSSRPSTVNWNGLLIGIDETQEEAQCLHNVHDLEARLKNCITFDNGSTLSLFSNPDLVMNIRTTKTTLTLATNALSH
jgi:hypothetical protein